MKYYLYAHQDYQGPLDHMSESLTDGIYDEAQKPLNDRKLYMSEMLRPRHGFGIFEIADDGKLKIVQESYDGHG